jgi:hypothetical protein
MRAIIVGCNKAKPHCTETRRSTCRTLERCNALPLIAPYVSSEAL